jgi:hypothetical protein
MLVIDECEYMNYCKFCYGVSRITERYLKVAKIFLISAVNFYYVIDKLIILVPGSH